MKCIILLFFSLVAASTGSAQKLTDTIFYNEEWKICERPIAEYYRLGTLAIDSFWFFTGPIEDYTMDGRLMMKGNYTPDGYKTGPFEFYYPDGHLQLKGSYSHDKMRGIWSYYYPDGKLKAEVYLPEDQNLFTMLKFVNKEGKTTLENGKGEFEWWDNEPDREEDGILNYHYYVQGEYNDTLRTGTWKYYRNSNFSSSPTLTFKEFYENGRVQKIKRVDYYNERVESTHINFRFQPLKIDNTEKILYDEFLSNPVFSKQRDSTFISYLVSGASPGITVKEKEFGKAFESMLTTLDKYRRRVDYADKDISGEIEFKLTERGTPEDISVTGNITEKEKRFIRYLVGKFQGVETPMLDSTIGVEGYHKIYFFTFKTSFIVPAAYQEYVPKMDFIFSILPKEKFLAFAKTLKPQIRKLLNRR